MIAIEDVGRQEDEGWQIPGMTHTTSGVIRTYRARMRRPANSAHPMRRPDGRLPGEPEVGPRGGMWAEVT